MGNLSRNKNSNKPNKRAKLNFITIVCTLCSYVLYVSMNKCSPKICTNQIYSVFFFFFTLIIRIQSFQYYNHDAHLIVAAMTLTKFIWSRIMCYRRVTQINCNICERQFYGPNHPWDDMWFACHVIYLEMSIHAGLHLASNFAFCCRGTAQWKGTRLTK